MGSRITRCLSELAEGEAKAVSDRQKIKKRKDLVGHEVICWVDCFE